VRWVAESEAIFCRLFLISTKQKGALAFSFKFFYNFIYWIFDNAIYLRIPPSHLSPPQLPNPSKEESMAKKKSENWRGALSFSSDRNCFPHRNRWVQATPLRVNVSSQKKWKEETRAIFLEKKSDGMPFFFTWRNSLPRVTWRSPSCPLLHLVTNDSLVCAKKWHSQIDGVSSTLFRLQDNVLYNCWLKG